MSRQKKAHGSGSLREYAPGKWQSRYKGQTETFTCTVKTEANRRHTAWVTEIDRATPATGTLTMNHLFDELVADQRRQGRTDLAKVIMRLNKHLRPHLGQLSAYRFDQADINRYIDRRLEERTKTGRKTRRGTVNRELSLLSRAWKLGLSKTNRILRFEKLSEEDGIRQTIVTEAVYRLMLQELPDHVKLFWVLGYYTGVRKGELLKLRWEWVNWQEWMIEVPGWFNGERITKNGKLHLIPIYCADMREFMKLAWQTRDPELPCLFQRRGQCIKSFRTAFEETRERLKLPGVLFHDLRRTAVTNMIRHGIPLPQAMKVSGHKSISTFKNYGIMQQADVQDVGRKMEQFFEQMRASEKVAEKNIFGPDLAKDLARDSGRPAGPDLSDEPKFKQ